MIKAEPASTAKKVFSTMPTGGIVIGVGVGVLVGWPGIVGTGVDIGGTGVEVGPGGLTGEVGVGGAGVLVGPGQ